MNNTAEQRHGRQPSSVWIVLVNWNGLDDTLACLRSLRGATQRGLDVHTVVVDNGSAIDPRPAIAVQDPDVVTVRFTHNRGFAAACNHGARLAVEAGAEYILLLNNDTLVEPGFLDPLVEYAASHERAAVVAPVICYAEQPEQVWFAGAKIVLAFGYFRHRHLDRALGDMPREPFATDYASGCCMLIPASVCSRWGLFDPQLFAYFEDADFCLRLREAGLKAVCVPQSVIRHKESSSTRRGLEAGTTSPLKHYLTTRNRIVTVQRHAGAVELAVFLLLGNPLRSLYYLLAFVARQRWHKLVYFFRGVVDGVRGKLGAPI